MRRKVKKISKRDYESYKNALHDYLEEILEETHARLHLIVKARSLSWAQEIAEEALKKLPFKKKDSPQENFNTPEEATTELPPEKGRLLSKSAREHYDRIISSFPEGFVDISGNLFFISPYYTEEDTEPS